MGRNPQTIPALCPGSPPQGAPGAADDQALREINRKEGQGDPNLKKTPRILLPGLSLAVLLLAALPLESPSRAQEKPSAEDLTKAPTPTLHLLPGGHPTGPQAEALERARLERELILAERSARMLLSLEEALDSMARNIQ